VPSKSSKRKNTKKIPALSPEGMMTKPALLSTWDEIVKYFGDFPTPRLSFDEDGEMSNLAWVFRGVSDAAFRLEPSIERSAKNGRTG
jgi:hypothetical protein